MSWVGLEAALLARLSGRDPSYVPTLEGGDPLHQFAVIGGDRVALWNPNNEGVPHELAYPSISYDVSSVEPRYDVFHRGTSNAYGSDRVKTPVAGSERDVDGALVARMDAIRSPGEPVNFSAEVRLYSRTSGVMASLVSYAYAVFPPRGFIRVPRNGGGYASWNMFFSAFQDLDKREATVAGLAEREYCKVFTYRVEGHLDTTDSARYRNRVNSVELNF